MHLPVCQKRSNFALRVISTREISIAVLISQSTCIGALFLGWLVTVDVIILVLVSGKDIEDIGGRGA